MEFANPAKAYQTSYLPISFARTKAESLSKAQQKAHVVLG
jgi:hypothetical protein